MAARDIVLMGVMVFSLAIAFFVSFGAFNDAFDGFISNTKVQESEKAVATLENSKNLTNRFDYVTFVFFLGFIIALLITGWLIGGNPIFMFLYFIFIVVSVVLGMFLSNTWGDVTQRAIFGSDIASFPLTNHIMLYLPIYLAVAGFVGLIAMFAKPYTENSGL